VAVAETFDQLYARCHPWVYAYLLRRLKHRETAQDLASEVFTRALAKFDAFEDRGADPQAWLGAIARNLFTDYVRSHRVQRELAVGELHDGDTAVFAAVQAGDPWHALMHTERRRTAVAALRHLTHAQRRCLVLRFIQGLSLDETAAALDISVGAVKQMQFRALRSARRNLEGTLAWSPCTATPSPTA
jgi:RNA polymerase sigma-70 factor (ECF subfamily)